MTILSESAVGILLRWLIERTRSSSSTHRVDSRDDDFSDQVGNHTSAQTKTGVQEAGPKENDPARTKTQEGFQEVPIKSPQDWSTGKRILVAGVICLYTFVVYAGSAIYIIGIPDILLEFDIGEEQALLGLSLYVLAYGLGPMIWAPMSELDFIGRSPTYAWTFVIFFCFSIFSATAKTWKAFLVSRFFQGFFGSPCLAIGGASMHDLFPDMKVPYALAVWIAAAYCGPALGPLISGYLVPGEGWRVGMWEIVWMTAPTLVLVLLLPETHEPTIRARAAHKKARSSQELRTSCQRVQVVLIAISDAMIKPIQIMVLDPAVAIANIYTSFVYGTYYTFFDAFPRVYPINHSFTAGELGLAFLCIFVACMIGGISYSAYVKFALNSMNHQTRIEGHLRPALLACILPPIGLFIFGWTSEDTHWAVSLVGVTVYAAGIFIILQCLCVYLPQIYPVYAASLFAANDLCRSVVATAAIHIGIPLYGNLGIKHGVSVLGAISVLGIPGMWYIYMKGPALRAKSRFFVQ